MVIEVVFGFRGRLEWIVCVGVVVREDMVWGFLLDRVAVVVVVFLGRGFRVGLGFFGLLRFENRKLLFFSELFRIRGFRGSDFVGKLGLKGFGLVREGGCGVGSRLSVV